MRIIFWSELFWPYVGGIELSGMGLIPALRERGYEFIVVTSHDFLDLPDEEQYKGIPVFRFPFRRALARRDFGQLMEVRQHLAQLKRTFAPDLVHVNSSGSSILFYLNTMQAYAAPLLVTIRSGLGDACLQPDTIMGRLLRQSSWVTSVSASLLAEVHRQIPQIIPRSSLIYDGMASMNARPKSLPIDAPLILCLGRLIHDKGFDRALTGFASIPYRFPKARLVIGGDGPMRVALEQQAADLDLSDSVTFIGLVAPDEVPGILNKATMVLMPSRREGLPRVALEAALAGRPVVATRVGGLTEIIEHQKTGLLVDEDDRDGLAEAISFLLQHADAAVHMGKAARRRARTMFSWERCVDNYDALYRKIGEGRQCVLGE